MGGICTAVLGSRGVGDVGGGLRWELFTVLIGIMTIINYYSHRIFGM